MWSNEPAVDPVGACVGPKGSRVRIVVNELRGEKIDVVPWSDDAAEFVANALQPAKVKEVRVDPDPQTAQVIVPDYQLSLAIGKEGQNARLAARLTGWRIDIKSESQGRRGAGGPGGALAGAAGPYPARGPAPGAASKRLVHRSIRVVRRQPDGSVVVESRARHPPRARGVRPSAARACIETAVPQGDRAGATDRHRRGTSK